MGIQPWDAKKTISNDSFHVYWVHDLQQLSEPFKGFSLCKTEVALLQHQWAISKAIYVNHLEDPDF